MGYKTAYVVLPKGYRWVSGEAMLAGDLTFDFNWNYSGNLKLPSRLIWRPIATVEIGQVSTVPNQVIRKTVLV